MNVTQDLSILHLILQASAVVQVVMALLAGVSLMSWYYIAMKWFAVKQARSKTEQFERDFWSGGDLNNNPSPGNKAGGITTILEKSLGAVAKAGRTGLMDVLEYAEPVRAHGLVFMDTPGYDPVSATGQVAGGANLICFTTGRGSTYGCKPTPSLKLASNTPMFTRMSLDMDFDCGGVVDGRQTIQEAGAALLQLMVATASGQRSKSEDNGLGDNEFLPWQLGAVM